MALAPSQSEAGGVHQHHALAAVTFYSFVYVLLLLNAGLGPGFLLHAGWPHLLPLPFPGLRPPLVLVYPSRKIVSLLRVTRFGWPHPTCVAHWYETVHDSLDGRLCGDSGGEAEIAPGREVLPKHRIEVASCGDHREVEGSDRRRYLGEAAEALRSSEKTRAKGEQVWSGSKYSMDNSDGTV